RLMMVLHDRVSHHASTAGFLTATLLAALALPSWTLAHQAKAETTPSSTPDEVSATSLGDPLFVALNGPDADDDEDEDAKPAKKPKAPKAKKASKVAKKPDQDNDDQDAPKPKKSTKVAKKPVQDEDDEEMEAKIKQALGPDFEKKMEALGEKIG